MIVFCPNNDYNKLYSCIGAGGLFKTDFKFMGPYAVTNQ